MDETLYKSYMRRLKNMTKVCRFCVRKRRRLTAIHSAEPSKVLMLSKLFNQVTQLQLVTNADYPDYICHECEKALQRTADCILAFKESDVFWRMYFQRKGEHGTDNNGNLPGDSEESRPNNFKNDMDAWSESEANNEPAKEKENLIIERGAANGQPLPTTGNHQYPIEEIILGDIQIKIENPDMDAFQPTETIDCVKNKETNPNDKTDEKTEESRIEELQKFECCNCDEKFNNKSELDTHINLYHRHNLCLDCGEQFSDSRTFSNHLAKHLRNKRNIVAVNGMFSCVKCNKLFKSRAVCRRHLHAKHKETVLICTKCKSSFFSLNRLRNHMDQMHSTKATIQCDICKSVFHTRKQIMVHMNVHMRLSFMCEICGWKLKSLGGMRQHQLQHTQEKKKKVKKTNSITQLGHLPCPLCPLAFIRGAALREHIKDKHPVEGPSIWEELLPRMCIKCDEIFASDDELKAHRKIHNKFKCTVCKNYLSSKDALEYHMKTHPNKERPHACHLCPATYTMRNHLNSHIRCVHTTERPHMCSVCQKTFAEKYMLDKHIRSVHLREKNHPCDKCDKRYYKKSELAIHYQYHTGVYRYRCKICNKNYGNSSMLFSHNKHHHPNE